MMFSVFASLNAMFSKASPDAPLPPALLPEELLPPLLEVFVSSMMVDVASSTSMVMSPQSIG